MRRPPDWWTFRLRLGPKLGLQVALADFCVDPNAATEFYMKQYASENDHAVVDYYVHCAPGAASPLASYFADARAALLQANDTWNQLDDCGCFGGDTVLMGKIYADINTLDGVLDAVQSEASCGSFYAQYKCTVDAACEPGLVALALLFSGHIAIGLLFAALVPILVRLWPLYGKMVSYRSIQHSPTGSTHFAGPYVSGAKKLR